jgi:aminodeoxyfutalosine synthase
VLADDVRRRINGDRVTFLRVLEVPPGGPLPLISPDTGEVRIAGLPAASERMIERVREVARVAGDVPISACALHELSGRLAERLRAAGVSHVAEAAVDRLLDRSVLNDVRSAGLDIARWTVQSYDPLPPLELLEQVRDLGPIPSFAPLPRAIDPSAPTTGYDDVKIVAVARLFLSKVNAISVDWSLYGPKLAQVALTFGSSDLDAVPAESGAVNLLGPRRTALEEVRRNIRAAALTPVARDLRFRTLS